MTSGRARARRAKIFAAVFAVASLCVVHATVPAAAFELVTPMEANAGPYVGKPETRGLSFPPGPRIIIRSPNINGADKPTIHAPIKLDVEFAPIDGSQVDMSSLRIIYLKLWGIDITDRIRPYLTKDGIYAENADLPAGEHAIEIDIKDNLGRMTKVTLTFTVVN
jgi:hypothetical protein